MTKLCLQKSQFFNSYFLFNLVELTTTKRISLKEQKAKNQPSRIFLHQSKHVLQDVTLSFSDSRRFYGLVLLTWDAKVNKCNKKIPMRMDPDATVIAPRTIKVILVIKRRRDLPELPLNFFIFWNQEKTF